MKNNKPRILFIDIETSPLEAQVWGLFDQNVGLNQITKDWHLLAFAALWSGDSDNKIIYADQSKEKEVKNDKKLLDKVWKLLDEADVVVSHSGRKFDTKSINARFAVHGMKPPSSYKEVDTCKMAKKHFRFSSYKLEYLTSVLCKKHKKSKHKKFPGHDLWKHCLLNNKEAWREMASYNKLDVLSMQELYETLRAWDNPINPNVYTDEKALTVCTCGATEFQKNGFAYTSQGMFQRWVCKSCGCEHRDKKNLLSKEKREALLLKTTR